MMSAQAVFGHGALLLVIFVSEVVFDVGPKSTHCFSNPLLLLELNMIAELGNCYWVTIWTKIELVPGVWVLCELFPGSREELQGDYLDGFNLFVLIDFDQFSGRPFVKRIDESIVNRVKC